MNRTNDRFEGKATGTAFVDRAKGLRGRILNATLPQRFVFHHVPKCGGTSVGRAFRKRYLLSQATISPEASFRAYQAFTGRQDREQMLVDVLDLREQMLLYHLYSDTRCVSAHVAFSDIAYSGFSDSYKFVTILREPVSRFLSHFNWSHARDGAHARIEEDFDTFLETERAKRMGATYVEYFAGRPPISDIATPKAIAKAICNLNRFDVVGRLDDMARFERNISDKLGFRVRIGHENRASAPRSGIQRSNLTTAQLQKVQDLCAPDIAIYEAAP